MSPGRRPRGGGGRDRRPAPSPARRPGEGTKGLRRTSGTSGLGGDQVEGRQAVLELLRAGTRPVRQLWVAEGLDASPQLDEIERLAARRKVPVLLVPHRRFDAEARTASPQGVLARAAPLAEADLDSLAESRRPVPFLLVLDGVTDPHNLGSLLRTAELAGVTGVVIGRHRAAHVSPAVAKVAAGAIEHVPIAVVAGIPGALARLEERSVARVGLAAEATTNIYELGVEADGPLALVLGAEGRGLAALSRKRCSVLASIPRYGRLDSLNVATAGAVACFELARRRSRDATTLIPEEGGSQ